MGWFRRSSPSEPFTPPTVQFLGEQDGVPEGQLKAAFNFVFAEHPNVQRAYLAQARYAISGPHNVPLCLVANSHDDEALLRELSDTFVRLFRSEVHMDLLFLSPDQEEALARVCRPFYTAA